MRTGSRGGTERAGERDSSRDVLLYRIARCGWTEEIAREFDSELGPELRRLVVVHLYGLGLVEFRFNPDRASEILSARRLELLDNTLTDLWLLMLRGFVSKYVHDRDAGKVKQEFLAYVSGVVRNTLVENARRLGLIPKRSFVEMLRDLCRSSGEETRRRHLATIKYHLESWARREVLSLCPSDLFDEAYRNRGHVLDYFFEIHVPGHCEIICQGSRMRVLRELLGAFDRQEYTKAVRFQGKVNPTPAFSVLVDAPTPASDDAEDRFVELVTGFCAGGA
ncbi:MAG: hypothetical protein AB7V19_07580 [Candidatus Bipolaricaulia bacterium]